MNEQKQFTVFTRSDNKDIYYVPYDNLTLGQAVCEDFTYTPVAWMPGWPADTEELGRYCEEAIAAGRIIEKVGNRYIARGLPEVTESKALFRVGGVYLNQHGVLVRIAPLDGHFREEMLQKRLNLPGHRFGWAKDVDRDESEGFVSLECGLTVEALRTGRLDSDGCDLIPGELHNVNGQWVPVEMKEDYAWVDFLPHAGEVESWNKAECIAKANAAMIARDGPAKPAVAAVVQEPKPTAKPSLCGLTRISQMGHQFGSAIR